MTTTTFHPRCPRCHKRLRLVAGQDGTAGTPSTTYDCDNCEYTERGRGATSRPWTREERLRRIRIAREQLYGPRPDGGVVIPLAPYDPATFPAAELDEAVDLAESEPVGHLDLADLAGA
jgi:hypothetical protein